MKKAPHAFIFALAFVFSVLVAGCKTDQEPEIDASVPMDSMMDAGVADAPATVDAPKPCKTFQIQPHDSSVHLTNLTGIAQADSSSPLLVGALQSIYELDPMTGEETLVGTMTSDVVNGLSAVTGQNPLILGAEGMYSLDVTNKQISPIKVFTGINWFTAASEVVGQAPLVAVDQDSAYSFTSLNVSTGTLATPSLASTGDPIAAMSQLPGQNAVIYDLQHGLSRIESGAIVSIPGAPTGVQQIVQAAGQKAVILTPKALYQADLTQASPQFKQILSPDNYFFTSVSLTPTGEVYASTGGGTYFLAINCE